MGQLENDVIEEEPETVDSFSLTEISYQRDEEARKALQLDSARVNKHITTHSLGSGSSSDDS